MNKIKPLTTNFTMLVAASSRSGKTKLVQDLIINHYMMLDKPLDEVVWVYHKHAFDENLERTLKRSLNIPVKFVEGFPAKELSEGSLFSTGNSANKMLVLDDVVTSALKSPVFIDLFTIVSHHNSMNVVAIIQNMHADTAAQRQVMNNVIRNLSYLVLFPDRRNMSGCKQVARTYFHGEEDLLVKPFKHLIDMKEKYHYMVVDFVDQEEPVKFNTLRLNEEGYLLSN